MDRDEAWKLLTAYTESDSLRKHALAVEAAMRHYARRFDEDEEYWGVTGLLHDFDYEKYPQMEDHPVKGAQILREKGYPEEMVTAILGHGDHTGVPRVTRLAKVLYAVDELTGMITAAALIRPDKSVMQLEASSVIKRMKDKAFARAVSREGIRQGAEDLGLPLEEHIGAVITAMRGIAEGLGLQGK
jgi:putative nucleotidyltransferase with HDIG domain